MNMSGDDAGFASLDPRVKRCDLRGFSRFWNIGKKDVANNKNSLIKLALACLGVIKKITVRCGDLWWRLVFAGVPKIEGYDVVLAFRPCAPCYYFCLHRVNAGKKIGFVHGERKYMGDISSWSKYFKTLDAIACVSDAARKEFAAEFSAYSDKFHCVHNCCDISTVMERAREAVPQVYDDSKVNMVTVGRIDDEFKQIFFIPRICRQLVDRGMTNFHWYIVGDGPDLKKNVALAEELKISAYITFVGWTDNPHAFVAKSDLFVMTSVSEGYPMVLVEAHALGIPVVSTKFSSVSEVVTDGVDGVIVENTTDAVADCLFQLFSNDGKQLAELQMSTRVRVFDNEEAYQQLMCIIQGT